MKIITHVFEGITTEFYSETFLDVLEKLQGKEGLLNLELWHDGIFVKEAPIGDLKDNLQSEDYYHAYCKVTN